MSDNNIYNNHTNISEINNDETIIKFNLDNIDNEERIVNVKRSSKQFNISPIVRRTPNTKADIIIQKIYSNRKNVIKNYNNTLTNLSSKLRDESKERNYKSVIIDNNDKLYNFDKYDKYDKYDNQQNMITTINTPYIDNNNSTNDINIDNSINDINESPSLKNSNIKDNSSSDSSPDKSITPLSEYCIDSKIERYKDDINMDKRKRRFYRNVKYKKEKGDRNDSLQSIQFTKSDKNIPISINEIESPKVSPLSSPRDITQDLWNDSVENYYIEFQKLCKEEANKFKYLSHRYELISNLLKFILLISGCFTFTLSISIPNSLFMSTTTTVSSCLTAIITSLTGFYQFDKKSEIQYNIYRELDKLYNTISLEMLKPTYMRADPYEYILSLRNRRDELLKTLQKK